MDWSHGHRPYPPPSTPWAMRMTWVDLLFMHWRMPVHALRPFVPTPLRIESFDGSAWLGIVPFVMTGTRPRLAPPVPGLSTFPELNVRTYVRFGGKPGVFFFSLDAASLLAVWGARALFRLNYYHAAMRVQADPHTQLVRYQTQRLHRAVRAACFDGWYRPTGPVARASPGDLASFLTDRYCLYTTDRRNRVYRCEIHHGPWPLQPAEAEVTCNTMVDPLGLALPAVPPLLHFARRLDVVAWRLRLA